MILPPSMLKLRNLFSGRLHHLGYILPTVLVTALVASGIVRALDDEHDRFLAAQKLTASDQLAKVASTLETNIHGNVNLIHGLVASISINPWITQQQFAALAEQIFSKPSQLRNVAAAPDLVVRMVYPLAQNKQILGMDYATHPKQSASVLEAVKRRVATIAGPADLIQGGKGLFVRYPVFLASNGHFWGAVSTVIDVDRLLRESNVVSEHQPLEIAIARRPDPRVKDVFFGDALLFNQDVVRTRIDLGYDTWYLAAAPKAGWQTVPPQIGRFYIYAALIALCAIAPMIWAGLLMRQRQRNIVTLQQREEQLETLSQRLRLALDASEIGVWEYEPSSGAVLWDRRMQELYGMPETRPAYSYDDWRLAVHPDDVRASEKLMMDTLDKGLPYITQFRVVLPTGEVRHLRAHGAVYRTSSGVQRLVGANWDVTADVRMQTELREARARAEAQNDQLRAVRRTLEHQSLHDALTGLPNRRFLDQFMEAADTLDVSARLAFIHFDLDRFKEVNDTLGHAAGDEVLKEVTNRVLKLIGHDEFVSRIGGDEFVVVTSGPSPEQRVRSLAAEIIKALAQPILFGGQQCHVGCSAGIACQTMAAEQPRQLLINADVALYEAKKRGRNRAEEFSESLLQATIHIKRTSDELLTALANDQIVPYFQPQFDAATHVIAGVEALARWQHPSKGLLTPDKFLSIADGLHRSAEIDAIILEKALFQASRWRALGLDVPKLSVNISAQRLKDDRLMKRLSELPFIPGTLSFELLESISFDEQDQSLRDAILHLKDMGIDIEIDDFGTGHASIVSLIELGPKRLKIDRKLIAPVQESASQRRLVSSIIEIGHSQGIGIVAEGVETMAQADILCSLGCQTLQGYAFSKPLSANDFVVFAARWQETRQAEPRLAVAQAG